MQRTDPEPGPLRAAPSDLRGTFERDNIMVDEIMKMPSVKSDGRPRLATEGRGTSRAASRHAAFTTLLLCSLLASALCVTNAATFHVRVDGDDRKCDGRTDAEHGDSPRCAFASPQRCARAVGSGDTCLIHAGTFDSCPSTRIPLIGAAREAIMVVAGKRGSVEAPIVFRGFGDGPVVFEAGDSGDGNRCDYAIFIDDSEHVVVGGTGTHEGLTIRGDFDHNEGEGEKATYYDGGTIAVKKARYVSIIGNTLEGSTHATLGDRNTEIRFFGSLTGHELAYNDITWRATRSAVALSGGQRCCDRSGGCTEADKFRVHHNRFVWDSAQGSYRIFGLVMRGCRDCEIYNNYFQCGDPSRYSEGGLWLYIRDDIGARIYNNQVRAFGTRTRSGSPFGIYFLEACPFLEGRTRDVITSENHRVYNNTIYGASRAAIRLRSVQGTQVRNNLVYGHTANAWDLGIGGDGFSGKAGYSAFNNVANPWPGGATCAESLGAENCDSDDTNVYEGLRVEIDRSLPGTPLRLRANSPLIDAGMAHLDAPGFDYDDEPRTGNPDIGADEFTSGATRAGITATITDLAAMPRGPASVLLTWTIPWDHERSESVDDWDVRYATRPITTEADFDAALRSTAEPTPPREGELELQITDLAAGTIYYFAVRRIDPTAGNRALSNEASANTRFPGYGYATTGGSGGDVYHVTSLADSGPGTLRAGVHDGRVGPRTIVFDVGGTITLLSDIRVRNSLGTDQLSIDGSTAPRPGITIRKQPCPTGLSACPIGAACLSDGEFKIGGSGTTPTGEVLLTHLRFQGNYRLEWGACRENSGATLGIQNHFRNIVLDHLTVRNGSDASPDLWTGSFGSSRVSILNSLIAFSNHPLTISDSGAGSRDGITIHRNVLARSGERMPQVRGATNDLDFRNNVIFDWGANGTGDYGMRIRNGNAERKPNANVVNNVFIAGGGKPRNAFYYGRAPGSRSTPPGGDGGPPGCTTGDHCVACGAQGTVARDTSMGELWVSGNLFPSAVCEKFSTVDTERPVLEAARVSTDDTSRLIDSILPSVGTHYRTADEQSLLDEVASAMTSSMKRMTGTSDAGVASGTE